ncbi:MAG: carboxypeptidase-like regulatory domain-containing protein [Bacteroidota bacterium]
MPTAEGVEVTLQGIEPSSLILTDSEGRFIFDDIPAGTYNLLFNKQGFREHYTQGIRFVPGPDTLFLLKGMREFSTLVVNDLELEVETRNGNDFLLLKGTIKSGIDAFSTYNVWVYFDDEDKVSNLSFPFTPLKIRGKHNDAFSEEIFLSSFGPVKNQFESGNTVYVALYGDSGASNFNSLESKSEPIGLSQKSNVVSFIMP